jgi:NADP-dependent alcohol dehydrogenase
MREFTFQNPTRIIFGKGQIQSLRDQIPTDARILMLAGGGSIKTNGVYQQVREALSERICAEHWGIEPNPDVAGTLRALELIKSERVNYLLAVGGGSVVDATKFLAGIAVTAGEPLALLARGGRFTGAVPLGVVLTAPGTGSESNSTGAISNRATSQKQIFSSPFCYPQFAILDPESTYTLPARQIANGVVDAYVHVLEQYLTFQAGGMLSDRIAEGILLTLRECGPLALLKPEDYVIRANLMWSSTLALNGLIGLGVPQDWTTHHIGHELTALHGIDHARSLAAVMPSVMKARRQQKADKILQYGARVFGILDGELESRINSTIQQTREFFESLGVQTRLGDYGIHEDDIPRVIANLKAARRVRFGERLDITLEQVAGILKDAL